jgi:DNA-binding MarR family transcriptional regulator
MRRNKSATEEMQTLGALLRTPVEVMLDHHFDKLAEAGFADVRIAHGAVLRHIARDGSRITELAERARVTKQSMAELVEYLRARGYVELVPDPHDGRAKLVRLTARGWKVHATLVAISGVFERKCAEGLGEHKWQQLRSLLEEFAAWAKASAPDGGARHGPRGTGN